MQRDADMIAKALILEFPSTFLTYPDKFWAEKIWNPDAIRTETPKIWASLSGHKLVAAIWVPDLYSGVLLHFVGRSGQ